jgi:hypothetical protein
MTAVLLNATTFFQFVSLFSSFLFGAWNNFGIVEHFRGTMRASWNNPARPGVEQFAHRGTFSWNNFGVVEQFFFKKKV